MRPIRASGCEVDAIVCGQGVWSVGAAWERREDGEVL